MPDSIRHPGYMENKIYYVYILASNKNGTIYIGITSNLEKRIQEHKAKHFEKSFTSKYDVSKLVYYEHCHDIESAISREKLLKKWPRLWKLELIEKDNPDWKDLSGI